MQTRFTWILAVVALISVAVLLACSTKYSSSYNGLVVVSTQGNADMDTFSLDLGNGHIQQIFNSAGPPTSGQPTAVVLDPAGDYAYVMVFQSAAVNASLTGIESFQVASDGKLGSGKTYSLLPIQFIPAGTNVIESIPALPVTMVLDSSGSFLFVADAASRDGSNNEVPGAVSVFAVKNGGLTEVAGSPFTVAELPGGITRGQTPTPSALAITPTVYPSAFAVCSGNVPPTTENLYVTDSNNYVVLNYSVSSTGALTPVSENATGTVPSGVTVDPCNRFVYVSNSQPDNSVSAFTICTTISLPTCPNADYSLLPVSSTLATTGNNPGPLLMDAYANFLYVLNTGGNSISAFKVSTTTGSLTPLSPTPIPTSGPNGYPTSMAIRSDDSWLFVANLNAANLSQYAITPSTGALIPQAPIQTDNFPWGVAVK